MYRWSRTIPVDQRRWPTAAGRIMLGGTDAHSEVRRSTDSLRQVWVSTWVCCEARMAIGRPAGGSDERISFSTSTRELTSHSTAIALSPPP